MSDIKELEITDIFGLEEPATKLIETVSNGIGKVYEPIHIKRMAKAKRDEIKIIGESITDNIDLPIKYDNGKISIESTDIDELIKRTGNRVLYREFRKQQNIETIIGETYSLLEKEEKVTAEPVNVDWIYQFFDMAGEISDEYMQKLWAKILAGEIKQPNTYTLRTLNTIKNITTYEANLYSKLVPFMIFSLEGPSIYNDVDLLEKYNISFDDLLKLDDCGLIRLNDFVQQILEDEKLVTDEIVFVIQGKISFQIYTITESGKQIGNLMKKYTKCNNEYFFELFNKLKINNGQCRVYKIESIEGKNINYDETKDLL